MNKIFKTYDETFLDSITERIHKNVRITLKRVYREGKQPPFPFSLHYTFPVAHSARAQIGTKLKWNNFEPEILSGVIIIIILAGTVRIWRDPCLEERIYYRNIILTSVFISLARGVMCLQTSLSLVAACQIVFMTNSIREVTFERHITRLGKGKTSYFVEIRNLEPWDPGYWENKLERVVI